MSYENGIRVNARIEKDIIPFLIRNYLWDKEKDEPNKSMIKLQWVQKIMDRQEGKDYWHFTNRGKENICILINNIY